MTDNDDLCQFPATNGPCSNPATGEDGYCWLATHSDDPADREPDGRGAPEGNRNAAKVAAWAEDFYEGFLTEGEKKRVEKSAEILGTQAGTQEIGRHAASVCLEQFRRTGDERFMRRFESICDKFGIAPADELEVEQSHSFDATEGVTAQFVTYESDDE